MFIKEPTLDFVLDLYAKYIEDLRKVRMQQAMLYKWNRILVRIEGMCIRVLRRLLRPFGKNIKNPVRLNPQFDELEAEMTYLLIRESKPEIVVEFSPCGGWSTTWILHALKDNKFGSLYSYDLIDTAKQNVPKYLSRNRWFFIKGDVKASINRFPPKIDYLFIDSDHSKEFAEWYIKNIFTTIKNGTPVSIHDVFHTANPMTFCDEGGVIINWLNLKRIKYFTASYAKATDNYNNIMRLKKELNIDKPIHTSRTNPAIFFIFKKE